VGAQAVKEEEEEEEVVAIRTCHLSIIQGCAASARARLNIYVSAWALLPAQTAMPANDM
jgi:hypothetical protein